MGCASIVAVGTEAEAEAASEGTLECAVNAASSFFNSLPLLLLLFCAKGFADEGREEAEEEKEPKERMEKLLRARL